MTLGKPTRGAVGCQELGGAVGRQELGGAVGHQELGMAVPHQAPGKATPSNLSDAAVSMLVPELDQGTSIRPLPPGLHRCFQGKARPALTPPSPLPGDARSHPCPPKDHVEM